MSCTGQAWIIGSKSHLHHVEQTFCHLRPLDESHSCFFHRQAYGSSVVLGRYDKVHFLSYIVIIGLIMMNQRPTRCFDTTDPDPLQFEIHIAYILAGQQRIIGNSLHMLCRLQGFDQPCSMVNQDMVTWLTTQCIKHRFIFLSNLRTKWSFLPRDAQ